MDNLDFISYISFLAKVRTAVNICIGDDGRRSSEVVETLQQLLKMTDAEYFKTWQNYG
jgi:hypothetical protein